MYVLDLLRNSSGCILFVASHACVSRVAPPLYHQLAEFYDLFFPSMKGHKIAKQVGKNDPSNVGAEAALDTQCSYLEERERDARGKGSRESELKRKRVVSRGK